MLGGHADAVDRGASGSPGGWLHRLLDEAWHRARRRRRRLLIAGAVAAAALGVVLAAEPFGGEPTPPPVPAPRVSPPQAAAAVVAPMIDPNANVPVTFTAERATGVFGESRHSYWIQATAADPAVACVNGRDAGAPDGVASGTRLTVALAVRQGEGGELGWCPGSYQGTIKYREDFLCPTSGRCQVPSGFPEREIVVARFSFRVPTRSERSAGYLEFLSEPCPKQECIFRWP